MKYLLMIVFIFGLVDAKEIEFISSDKKVNLIELYTSQGCSSCPPADKWLSKLKDDKNLFKTFIPMAFHVTYWDYIGWSDKFASAKNDKRQRNYSYKVWGKNSVYTPQFIVDAKEYRPWFYTKVFPKLNNDDAGLLNIKYNTDSGSLRVKYKNKKLKDERTFINIAVLGFDYNINIKAGENNHKILKHDFVVLKHERFSHNISNSFYNKLNINKFDSKKLALVVWFENDKFKKYQAVAGYIR